MSQNLPVNYFEWIKDTFQFNKDFIKSYKEESDEGCFRENDVQHPEKLHELDDGLPFWPERMRIGKVEKPYIDMNAKLRQKAKNNFEKVFCSWWIMQILEKLWKIYCSVKEMIFKKTLQKIPEQGFIL